MTIFGHFIANYINIFHKTEVPTVILRCINCPNLNWIKSKNINHKWFLQPSFLNFGRKKPKIFIFKNGNFSTNPGHFFAKYMKSFHKREIQTVILRCLVCLNFNWVKNCSIFWLKYLFFHTWKSIISGVKDRSKFWYLRRKPAFMVSKWVFFQNSLVMSWAIK
jgi:hypothetical protein